MHNNSKLLFEKYAVNFFSDKMKVLEVGPHIPSPYQKILQHSGVNVSDWKYADIVSEQSEVYREQIDFMMPDEYKLPIGADTFDIVFSAQVFEHVRKPWIWMKELKRVVNPGGIIITIAPVSWPYHEAPIDCWRAHPEGMRAVLEEAGLKIELCISECLETQKRIMPGKGLDHKGTKTKIVGSFLSIFGWPIEAAIDIISVARK